jgi:hypothetical protein
MMRIKKCFSVLILSLVYLNLFGQVQEREMVPLTPIFSQTVSVNSERPYFEIKNLNLFPDNELLIYNRWGNEIFKASPYLGNWNCTVKGKTKKEPDTLIESGTYFYIIIDKKTQENYQGYFNFVR